MNSKKSEKIRAIVTVAVLAALVVVLQTVASGIKIGTFTVTLSLVPIIVGGALFGPLAGGFLGLVFSVVVLVAVLTGADAGGAIMLTVNPAATVIIVLLKGTVAGFVAGLISSKMRGKKLYPGVILASIAAPVCNTGIFLAGMLLFFRDLLAEWANGAGQENVATYIIVGLIGVNFLAELVIDLVLSPVIVRIIHAVRKSGGDN